MFLISWFLTFPTASSVVSCFEAASIWWTFDWCGCGCDCGCDCGGCTCGCPGGCDGCRTGGFDDGCGFAGGAGPPGSGLAFIDEYSVWLCRAPATTSRMSCSTSAFRTFSGTTFEIAWLRSSSCRWSKSKRVRLRVIVEVDHLFSGRNSNGRRIKTK